MENNFGDIATAIPPGISWSAQPKTRAWNSPPADVDVASIAQQYMAVLSAPEVANDVLDALESKAPIAVIAEAFMLGGVHKGNHSLDAGILVMPVIMETLQTIAEFNDIKTVMFPSDLDEKTVHPRVMRKVIESVMAAQPEEPAPPVAEEPSMGLMSRVKKEGM